MFFIEYAHKRKKNKAKRKISASGLGFMVGMAIVIDEEKDAKLTDVIAGGIAGSILAQTFAFLFK